MLDGAFLAQHQEGGADLASKLLAEVRPEIVQLDPLGRHVLQDRTLLVVEDRSAMRSCT